MFSVSIDSGAAEKLSTFSFDAAKGCFEVRNL